MSKSESKFRFKQFAVSHHRSSMKVGVDGVLIGCWVNAQGAERILDVGTGCGLIALIIAQRVPAAQIDAIDIDAASIEEAKENIASSPWSERIHCMMCDFAELSNNVGNSSRRYDLIVSNPPFFDSGVKETLTAREKARHQGVLSPSVILRQAKDMLNVGGSVAMVVPTDVALSLDDEASCLGFRTERKCFVRGHEAAPYKRVLLQWRLPHTNSNDMDINSMEEREKLLTLEHSPGTPTDAYRALCKDFYLRF